MAFFEVNKISKDFGRHHVLQGINFSMEKGEVLAILGSSGGGKTTLLRCINFLEQADKGSMSVDGKVIFDASLSPKELKLQIKEARKNFGLVFQQFNLFPQYTVLENVMLAPKLKGEISVEEIENKAREIIDKVGLTDKINQYPCQLSGGQQQRVAIARALIMEPAILCFDEPTSALDPELTGEVLKVIRSLKSSDRTMIIVTHEIAFAKEVADNIIFIDNGVIAEEGSAVDMIEHPQSPRLKEFLSNGLQK